MMTVTGHWGPPGGVPAWALDPVRARTCRPRPEQGSAGEELPDRYSGSFTPSVNCRSVHPGTLVVLELIEQVRLAARALVEFSGHLFDPTLRLGVTGLSHAGKTVFITALVHGLLRGGRFPVFEALATGRVARAHLAPQPDDAVPRFDYERHVRALVTERRWPESTRQISELRVIVEYQSQSGYQRKLTLDIVDYPGEWLLDLPLLTKSYETWAAESLRLSRQRSRAHLAADWHSHLSDP